MATLCDPNYMTSTEGKTMGGVKKISGCQGVSRAQGIFRAVKPKF